MLIVSGTHFQNDSSLQVRWGSRLLLNVGMLTKTCSPETQINRKMELVSIWIPERQNKRQLLGLQANWCPILWRLTKGDPSSLLHPSSGQHLSVSDPKTVSHLSQSVPAPACPSCQGQACNPQSLPLPPLECTFITSTHSTYHLRQYNCVTQLMLYTGDKLSSSIF